MCGSMPSSVCRPGNHGDLREAFPMVNHHRCFLKNWAPCSRPARINISSIPGGKRRRSGSFVSSETAQYCRKFASEYAGLASPLVSNREQGEPELTDLQAALRTGKSESAVFRLNAPPAYTKDGGGKPSSGDWSSVPPGELRREDEFRSFRENSYSSSRTKTWIRHWWPTWPAGPRKTHGTLRSPMRPAPYYMTACKVEVGKPTRISRRQ